MSVQEQTQIELRCPVGPRALLAKVRSAGDHERMLTDEHPMSLPGMPLLELACRDCARTLRKKDPDMVRVLHRFNVFGQLVESDIERR